MTTPLPVTVVVNTFDRPESLARLLSTLEGCAAPAGTDVVVSIDGGGRRRSDTDAVIASFEWTAGTVDVIHREDLGLVEHFRVCGDMSLERGPVVVLEDDLVVGPNALSFASAALGFYGQDDGVAGVSLSTPAFDGFRHQRFEPLLDGTDVVIAKLPWFHGMAFTPEMWKAHRGGEQAPSAPLPPAFDELTDDEWFPDLVRHLVATDSWWVLAREAHAVNFGDAGAHFDRSTDVFQRPLVSGRWFEPRFARISDGVITYDEYMEPDARSLAHRVPSLRDLDVTFDLRGVRPPSSITSEWVVSSRPSNRPVEQWGAHMHPLEQNLLSGVPGASLTLCRTADLETGDAADRRAGRIVRDHAAKGRRPTLKDVVAGHLAARAKDRTT